MFYWLKKKIVLLKIHFWLKRHKAVILAILGLVLLAVLSKVLYQWLAVSKQDGQPKIPVQVVKVKEAAMPSVIETIGSLSPIKEAKIKAATIGRVDKFLVEAGTWVKQGTALLTLSGGPEVKAPFDGYLTDWQVKEGEFVSPGEVLVDLVNTELLTLNYRVPEQFASGLDVGQAVELKVRTFPGKQFSGKLKFISPIVDKKTFTILLKAELQNPDQMLWPGMSAEVKHILNMQGAALVVPESTLILNLEGYELLVVEQDKLLRRKVKVGTRRGGRAEIVSGVNVNDLVLLTQTPVTAREGISVSPTEWTGEW